MSTTRKDREFAAREQEILEAALLLFAEHGLDKVTVADIARQTDIGKGTIYKHFTSKDEIFARLSLDFHQQLLTQIQELSPALDCAAQMKAMFVMAFQLHMDSPQLSAISIKCNQSDLLQRLSAEYQARMHQQERAFYEVIGAILQKGIQQGQLPDLPVEELLCGVHATFEGSLQLLRVRQRQCFEHTPDISEKRFLEIMINYMMAGLFGLKDQDNNTVQKGLS